jgi:hypothetical protein
MKKTDRESNRIGRLQFSSEIIRVLRPSELLQVAGGGSSEETANGGKRPL